jgi:hypothetical protein
VKVSSMTVLHSKRRYKQRRCMGCRLLFVPIRERQGMCGTCMSERLWGGAKQVAA